MTECPKCKGYGIIGDAVPDILRGRGHIFSSNECDMCHGSGEVEMTNEDWFCGLSTEEKAKWMAKHMSFCEICEIQTCRGDGCQRFDRGSMTETDAFREWLKEKHE